MEPVEKKEAGWTGNGQGSGQFQKQPDLLKRDSERLGLETKIVEKKPDPKVAKREEGFNNAKKAETKGAASAKVLDE